MHTFIMPHQCGHIICSVGVFAKAEAYMSCTVAPEHLDPQVCAEIAIGNDSGAIARAGSPPTHSYTAQHLYLQGF